VIRWGCPSFPFLLCYPLLIRPPVFFFPFYKPVSVNQTSSTDTRFRAGRSVLFFPSGAPQLLFIQRDTPLNFPFGVLVAARFTLVACWLNGRFVVLHSRLALPFFLGRPVISLAMSCKAFSLAPYVLPSSSLGSCLFFFLVFTSSSKMCDPPKEFPDVIFLYWSPPARLSPFFFGRSAPHLHSCLL